MCPLLWAAQALLWDFGHTLGRRGLQPRAEDPAQAPRNFSAAGQGGFGVFGLLYPFAPQFWLPLFLKLLSSDLGFECETGREESRRKPGRAQLSWASSAQAPLPRCRADQHPLPLLWCRSAWQSIHPKAWELKMGSGSQGGSCGALPYLPSQQFLLWDVQFGSQNLLARQCWGPQLCPGDLWDGSGAAAAPSLCAKRLPTPKILLGWGSPKAGGALQHLLLGTEGLCELLSTIPLGLLSTQPHKPSLSWIASLITQITPCLARPRRSRRCCRAARDTPFHSGQYFYLLG